MINILFRGNDDNPDLVFVETENDKGESISVGTWITDHDGYHVLRLNHCETLRAENEALKDACKDALSGWRYIRQTHGDLYGVGWDRVEDKLKEVSDE